MLIVKTNRFPQFVKAARSLSGDAVFVGIPEDKTARRNENAVTNAYIGYIHEKGSPLQNIPARPFLSLGVRDAKEGVSKLLGSAVDAALKDDAKRKEQFLNRAGLHAQSKVKAVISSGSRLAPNLPVTIERKGSSRPLVDSGQLVNAIHYVVRRVK